MILRKIFLLLMFVLSLSSCKANDVNDQNKEVINGLQKFDKMYYNYFNTVTTFTAYAKDENQFKEYTDLLEDELKKYDQFYNSYYDFDGVNNIKTINENAGKKPVKVDQSIIDMLLFSKEVYKKTDGKINIGLGNVIKLWHDAREESVSNPSEAWIPSKEELEDAAEHKDINQIKIDEENSTVEILDPKMTIDVGAIAKGYATMKIEKVLRDKGLQSGILSVGGDDAIIGDNPAKENGTWKIATLNPDLDEEDPYSSIVDVKNISVVTSGDYQRFFEVDGKKYHHIIDSDTLYPSNYFRSVTVIHKDIAIADALSTYLFTVDLEKGKQVAEEFDAEVFWIDKDNNEYKTNGYEKLEN